MRNYTTQTDAAKQGIITPEMKAVAAKEYRTEEEIRELVAKGQVCNLLAQIATCPLATSSLISSSVLYSLAATAFISGVMMPRLAASICVV